MRFCLQQTRTNTGSEIPKGHLCSSEGLFQPALKETGMASTSKFVATSSRQRELPADLKHWNTLKPEREAQWCVSCSLQLVPQKPS